MIEKIKQFVDFINYPYGINEEFDKACDTTLVKFLDGLYYVASRCLLIFGLACIYFFMRYEVLRV